MLLVDGNKEVEINDRNVPLLEPLFSKWGYPTDVSRVNVKDVNLITCELSAWGIPWKYC